MGAVALSPVTDLTLTGASWETRADDEVLLDDPLRYVQHAVAAGVDARVDVWEGMAHGFLSGIGTLAASNQALEAIAAFLTGRLAPCRELAMTLPCRSTSRFR